MRQVNLLPEHLQRTERLKTIRSSIAATVGLILLLVLPIHLLLALRVERLEKAAYQPGAIGETPELSQLYREISDLKVERQRLFKGNAGIIEVLTEDLIYPGFLQTIGEVASDKVWLTRLSVESKKGTRRFTGRSFSTQSVSEFMLELKKIPYLKTVELSSMEKASDKARTEIDFDIICNTR